MTILTEFKGESAFSAFFFYQTYIFKHIYCTVGYSDDAVQKMTEDDGYLGVKRNSKTLVKRVVQNFEPLLANWAVKF